MSNHIWIFWSLNSWIGMSAKTAVASPLGIIDAIIPLSILFVNVLTVNRVINTLPIKIMIVNRKPTIISFTLFNCIEICV